MTTELIGRNFYHPVKLIGVVVDMTLIVDAHVLVAYIWHIFAFKINARCGCGKCQVLGDSGRSVAPMADCKTFGENLMNLNACPRFDDWVSYHLIASVAKCKAQNMADKMGTMRYAVFCIIIIAKILYMLANKLLQIHYILLSV